MARDVGNRAFRRELDDHENRIAEIEAHPGGEAQIGVTDGSLDFDSITRLCISSGLVLEEIEDGFVRISATGGGGDGIVVSDGNNEAPTTLLTIGSGLVFQDLGEGEIEIDANRVSVSAQLGGEPTVPELDTLVLGYGLAIGEDSTPEFTVIFFDSPLEVRDQDAGKVEKATGWVFGPGFTVEEGDFADQAVISYEGSNLVVDGKQAVTEIQLGEGLEAEEVEPGVVLLKLAP